MHPLEMRKNNTAGFLITFCGLDGCGKTTMMNRLISDLEKKYEIFVTKQPTEMEEGQQKRVCMLCGEGENKVIPKICNHEFTDWITTKEPTETEAGERKRLCTICHEGEKETIPALGDGDVDENNSEDVSSSNNVLQSLAGCSSTLGASMGGVVFALASCVFVDKMRKKKNK